MNDAAVAGAIYRAGKTRGTAVRDTTDNGFPGPAAINACEDRNCGL